MAGVTLVIQGVKTQVTEKQDDGEGGTRDVVRDLGASGQFLLEYQLLETDTREVLFEGSRVFGGGLSAKQSATPEKVREAVLSLIQRQAEKLVVSKALPSIFQDGEEIALR